MLQRKATELPLALIHTNPDQPRKFFSEEELDELKRSIAEYGVLQPVIVKKEGNGAYSLIAGERRVRAARLAGLTKIPALIRGERRFQFAGIIGIRSQIDRLVRIG